MAFENGGLTPEFIQAFQQLAAGDSNALSGFNGPTGTDIIQQNFLDKQQQEQEQEDNSIEANVEKAKKEREDKQTKQMEGLDWLFGKAAQIGEGINSLAGMDNTMAHFQQEGITLENIGRGIGSLAGSLLTMPFSMPFDIAAKGYEAITGKPVTESHDDYMADYELNPEQRAAAGAEAAFMGALPFTGGVGGAAKGLAKLGKVMIGEGAEKMAAKEALEIGKKSWEEAPLVAKVGVNALEGAGFGAAGAFRGDEDTYKEGGPSQEDILAEAGQGAMMGGLMGLAGAGIGKVTNKIFGQNAKDQEARDTNTAAKEVEGNNPEIQYDQLTDVSQNYDRLESHSNTGILQSITDRVNQETAEKNREAASTSNVMRGNDEVEGDGSYLSTGLFRRAMTGEDEDNNRLAAESFAQALGHDDPENLLKMAREGSPKLWDELNGALEAKQANGENVYYAGFKNPSGSAEGELRLRLDKITKNEDNYMDVDQHIAHRFAGDFDGDIDITSFNPERVKNAMNPFRNMLSGFEKSAVDYDELMMGKKAFTKDGIVDNDKISEAYKKTFTRMGLYETNDRGETFFDHLRTSKGKTEDSVISDLQRAYNLDNNTDREISKVVMSLYDGMESWKDENFASRQTSKLLGAREGVMQDAFGKVATQLKADEQNYADSLNQARARARETQGNSYVADTGVKNSIEIGSIQSGMQNIGSFNKSMENVNVEFRLFGGLKYAMKQSKEFSSAEVPTALSDWLSKCFHLLEDGSHDAHQYKNTRNEATTSLLASEHSDMFTTNSNENSWSLRGDQNWSNVVDALFDYQKQIAKEQEAVMKNLNIGSSTFKEEVPWYNEVKLPKMDGSTFETKVKSLSEYFFADENTPVIETERGPMTMDMLCSEYYTGNINKEFLNNMYGSGGKLGDIVDILVRSREAKKEARGKSLVDDAGEIGKAVANGLDGKFDINNKENVRDVGALANHLAKLVPEDAFQKAGIWYNTSITEHPFYGKMWDAIMHNKTKEAIQNSILEGQVATNVWRLFGDIQSKLIEANKAIELNDSTRMLDCINDARLLNREKIAKMADNHAMDNEALTALTSYVDNRLEAITKTIENLESGKSLSEQGSLLTSKLGEIFEPFLRVDEGTDIHGKFQMLKETLHSESYVDEYKQLSFNKFIHDISGNFGESFSDIGVPKRLIAAKKYAKVNADGTSDFVSAIKRKDPQDAWNFVNDMMQHNNMSDADIGDMIINRMRTNRVSYTRNVIPAAITEGLIPSGASAEKGSSIGGVVKIDAVRNAVLNIPLSAKRFISMCTTNREAVVTEAELSSCPQLYGMILEDPNFRIVIKDNNTHTHVLNREILFKTYGLEPPTDKLLGSDWAKLVEQCPEIAECCKKTIVTHGNPQKGEAVVLKTSDEPLDQVLKAHAERYKYGNQDSVEAMNDVIRNSVLDIPSYVAEISNYLLGLSYTERLTYENINQHVAGAVANADKLVFNAAKKAANKVLKNSGKTLNEITEELMKTTRDENVKFASQFLLDKYDITGSHLSIDKMINDFQEKTNNTNGAYAYAKIMGQIFGTKSEQTKLNKALKKTVKNVSKSDAEKLQNDILQFFDNILVCVDYENMINEQSHMSGSYISSLLGTLLTNTEILNIPEYQVIRQRMNSTTPDALSKVINKMLSKSSSKRIGMINEGDFDGATTDQVIKSINKFLKKNSDDSAKRLLIEKVQGEPSFDGLLDGKLYDSINNYTNLLNDSNSLPRTIAEAKDQICLDLNTNIFNGIMNEHTQRAAFDKMSLENMRSARDNVYNTVESYYKLFRDSLNTNRSNNLNGTFNTVGNFTENDLARWVENVGNRYSDYIDPMAALLDKNRLNANSLVDQFAAGGNATNVGVSGSLTRNIWAFVTATSKLDPQLSKGITINASKPDAALNEFIAKLCETAFLDINRDPDNTSTFNAFNHVGEVLNGDYSIFNTYVNNNTALLRPNNFLRNVFRMSPNENDWIKLSNENLIRIIDAAKNNPVALTNETFFTNTSHGSLSRDAEAIISYLMENRILKAKKQPFDQSGRFVEDFTGIQSIGRSERDINIQDPAQFLNEIINFRNRSADIYRDNLQAQIFSNPTDSKSFPGILKPDIGDGMSIAPGLFDFLMPWIDLKTRDGKTIKVSIRDCDRVRNGEMPALINRSTGEPIEPANISKIVVNVQDPETINDVMLRKAGEAYRANPNISNDELIKIMCNVYEEPPAELNVARDLKDIISDNFVYNKRGTHSDKAYLDLGDNLQKELYSPFDIGDTSLLGGRVFNESIRGLKRNISEADNKFNPNQNFKNLMQPMWDSLRMYTDDRFGKDLYINAEINDAFINSNDLSLKKLIGTYEPYFKNKNLYSKYDIETSYSKVPKYRDGLYVVRRYTDMSDNEIRNILNNASITNNVIVVNKKAFEQISNYLDKRYVNNLSEKAFTIPGASSDGSTYVFNPREIINHGVHKNTVSISYYENGTRNRYYNTIVAKDFRFGNRRIGDAEALLTNSGQNNLDVSYRNTLDFNLPNDMKANRENLHIVSNKAELTEILSKLNEDKITLNLDQYDDISKKALTAQTRHYLSFGSPEGSNTSLNVNRLNAQQVFGIVRYKNRRNEDAIVPLFYNGTNKTNIDGRVELSPGATKGSRVSFDYSVDRKATMETEVDSFGKAWTASSDSVKPVSGDMASKGMATLADIDIKTPSGTGDQVIDGGTLSNRLANNSPSDEAMKCGNLLMDFIHENTTKRNWGISDLVRKSLKAGSLNQSQKEAILNSRHNPELSIPQKNAWLKFIQDNGARKIVNNNKDAAQFSHNKEEVIRALDSILRNIVAQQKNPYVILEKEMASKCDFGVNPVHALSTLAPKYDDITRVFNWLYTSKKDKVNGDDVVRFIGGAIDPDSSTKKPLFNGDWQRVVVNDNGEQHVGWYKRCWTDKVLSDQNSERSINSPTASKDLAQKVTSLFDTGNGDIKELLDLTADKRANPNDGGVYHAYLRKLTTEKAERETDMSTKHFATEAQYKQDYDQIPIHLRSTVIGYNKEYMQAFNDYRMSQIHYKGKISVFDPRNEKVTHDQTSDIVRSNLKRLLFNIGKDPDNEANIYYALETVKKEIGDSVTRNGDNIVAHNVFVEGIDRVINKMNQGKMPGATTVDDVHYERANGNGGRISYPIVENDLIEWLCDSPKLEGLTPDQVKSNLKKSIRSMAEEADLMTAGDKGKNLIHQYAYDSAMVMLGEDLNDLRYWGGQRYNDIAANGINLRTGGYAAGGDPDQFSSLMNESTKRLNYLSKLAQKRKYEVVQDDNSKNAIVLKKSNEDKTIGKVLRTSSMLSRGFGLLDPAITAQNVLDKGLGLAGQRLLLKVSDAMNGFTGKESFKNGFSESGLLALEKISKHQETTDFFKAWHTAAYNGEEEKFIYAMQSGASPSEYLKGVTQQLNTFEKAYNGLARIATGDPVFSHMRNKNAIDTLLKTLAEDGHDYLMDRIQVGDAEVPFLEEYLVKHADSPGQALAALFLGGDKNFATDLAGRKAWNITLKGDLAHNNVVNWCIENSIKDSSLADFLMCTLGNKYMRAATNTMGRTMNWVAPMSTFNYMAAKIFSEAAGKNSKWFQFCRDHLAKGAIKDFMEVPEAFQAEMEAIKGYNSLREALLVDAAHMTVPMLATMLAGAAFFEPPPDPDKACNYQEWTICGLRIGQNWWLDDILGIAAPLAAFWKSAEMGKPDFTIYTNGMAHHLSNNPFLKIGDCIGAVLNVDHSIEEAEEIASRYEKAPGGTPDGVMYMLGSLPAISLSYLSQFMTPAFLRDFDKVMKQYEVSYNRIYKVDANGNRIVNSDGTFDTERTSFQDAQIRKITRNNPVLGTLMNILPTGNQTSYVGQDMPRQVFYEPAQMAFMKKYSVLDENGNMRPDSEKQVIAATLLHMLNSTSNMKALRQQGFCLDNATKKYVSEVLHDMYQMTKDDFNTKKASGALDYKTLGNGDYNAGKAAYNKYYQAYQQQLSFWQDMYKNKLYSTDLNQDIQKYNRFNTTYLQDKNGNWYATGFREGLGGVLTPILYAPQESGRANDYASVSALNGQPLIDQEGNVMRAMVAAPNNKYNTPTLESWAKENNNGYSSNYSSPGYASSSYSRGGSRGGGGGGGSKSIRSHAPNLNIKSPSSPRQSNLRDTQYDYLRPNFEVSGSRQSYKRDTI